MASRPKSGKPLSRGDLKVVPPAGKRTPSPAATKPPTPLRTISASEFAARFAHSIREKQQSFTWFLGAGCSVTSRIPDAGGLVRKWLTEIHGFQKGTATEGHFDAWVARVHPTYRLDDPAGYYAEAFEARHPSPVERQREIETICAGGQPGYGYATLAQLISHREFGRLSGTVLTTNFDDLIADALYLYGDQRARPLVVTHEALARFVRTNSPRPTVVKLHGDAHIDPKNLRPETKEIHKQISDQLYPFLQDHGLIFCGYGGNDRSIVEFFKKCPLPPLAPPIYWVSAREPRGTILSWLRERGALRVDHTDFDKLMHLVRNAFQIDMLPPSRWTEIGQTYYQAFDRLKNEIDKSPSDSADEKALKSATAAVEKSLPEDWAYYLNARKHEKSDPDTAEKYFKDGLSKFAKSSVLNGMYAVFLQNVRKDMDAAESFYKRAIDADPNHANSLGNYAVFLQNVRKDMDAAESFYKRAIDADPNDANNLGNYAFFLENVRKDMDAAESFYKRHANSLGNYAQFVLGSGRTVEGLRLLDRAFDAATDAPPALHIELLIYRYAHDTARRDESLAEIKKAIEKGERTPGWSFDITLDRATNDSHPNPALLADIAAVASGKVGADVLNKYPEWRAA